MTDNRPTVVIIGAGFAGINAAKALRNAPVQVVMIDRNNHHLFQPLLYQVATAAIAPSEIAYPVRAIFRKQKNFKFRLAEVEGIDFETRRVHTSAGEAPYDYLILAVGGQTHFFGLDSVARYGFDLKDLADALDLRGHILRQFERASQATDPAELQALRTFAVVGGGPTGVECSGALSELTRLVLAKDFPEVDFNQVRVMLLEASDRLLAGFPEELARAAAETLKKKGVEVRFGASVADYDGAHIKLQSGERLPAGTLVWAAGVRAESLVERLGLPQRRQGRVLVEPTLQAPGHPEVFVVGDAAYMEAGGEPLPMMAPVAIQQGKTAARNILNLLSGAPLERFKYRDPGSLATIGRNAAVARIRGYQFSGFAAWVVWLAVHLFWLIGFRNRLLVLINWAWDYFLYERGVRWIPPQKSPSGRDPGAQPAAEDTTLAADTAADQAIPISLPPIRKETLIE
jgi:NADH dehydrogenase